MESFQFSKHLVVHCQRNSFQDLKYKYLSKHQFERFERENPDRFILACSNTMYSYCDTTVPKLLSSCQRTLNIAAQSRAAQKDFKAYEGELIPVLI